MTITIVKLETEYQRICFQKTENKQYMLYTCYTLFLFVAVLIGYA